MTAAPTILNITLRGHLTDTALLQSLDRVTSAMGPKFAVLIVDARLMTGYQEPARRLFVDWNARHRTKLVLAHVPFGTALTLACLLARSIRS